MKMADASDDAHWEASQNLLNASGLEAPIAHWL